MATRPTIGNFSIHGCNSVTVQRDTEHNCIDIVLTGSKEYLTTRISIWNVAGERMIPIVEMLPDKTADEEAEADV